MELEKKEDLTRAMAQMLEVCKQLKPYRDDPKYGPFHQKQFDLMREFANALNVEMAD
jgi:hypothetical protein